MRSSASKKGGACRICSSFLTRWTKIKSHLLLLLLLLLFLPRTLSTNRYYRRDMCTILIQSSAFHTWLHYRGALFLNLSQHTKPRVFCDYVFSVYFVISRGKLAPLTHTALAFSHLFVHTQGSRRLKIHLWSTEKARRSVPRFVDYSARICLASRSYGINCLIL